MTQPPSLFDRLSPYIRIARPDHWVKQVFVLPGILLAVFFTHTPFQTVIVASLIGLISVCSIASANYTINEWLDAEFDKFHPQKKDRPSVRGAVKGMYVYLEYVILALVGLGLALLISHLFFIADLALLIMGILYNVPPIRLKDRVYLDVISESVNNPLRLLLGWFMVTSVIIPPSTLILAFFFGGAFLMAAKRYAEYEFIADPALAAQYRKSFLYYNRESLLVSTFFYAVACAFFMGVFMIKYKVELIISFPFLAGLFSWYLYMAVQTDSPTRHPEGLYSEPAFMLYVAFTVALIMVLLLIQIPFLGILTQNIFLK